MIDPSSRMRPARGIVFREEDEGFLLYDAGRDILYQGNETGRQILILCDGRCTLEEMIDRLAGASGSPREEVSGYVCDFLGELRAKGLLELIRWNPYETA